MKIAHISATFPPYQGGTGNVCYYQARELARLGHEIHVLTSAVDGLGDDVSQDGVHTHRLRPLVQVGNAPVLPQLLWRLRHFDLVHLHYPFISGAEMVAAACRLWGIPYVVNYHNDLTGKGLRAHIFDLYTRVFSGIVFQGAQRLLAVTEDHALHCRLAALFRRHRQRLIELNNGVDVDHFCPGWNGSLVRQELGVDKGTPVVLFVAALDAAHHFKGLNTLLQSWRQVGTPAVLVIVGDGDRRAFYEGEAGRLGIAQQVRFAGKVQHDNLPRYFAAADLVVLPSTPPESFGLVLIEGMACAVPVIGSHIPGVRRVVDEGQTGFLVEPGNPTALAAAMRRVLTMPQTARDRLGEAGRRKAVTCYNWPVLAAQLETLYQEVLEGLMRLPDRQVEEAQ